MQGLTHNCRGQQHQCGTRNREVLVYPLCCGRQPVDLHEGRVWLMNCAHAHAVSTALFDAVSAAADTLAAALLPVRPARA